MKHNIAYTTLAILLLALVLTGIAPSATASTCTTASVAGNWGYTYSGALLLPTGPVPAAAVGQYTLDASGNISGTQTRTLAGGTAHEVLKGSATLNSDCTVTATIGIYDQSGNLLRTGILTGVYVNNGKELPGMFEALILPDGTSIPVVITSNAKRQ
jgi:hypothetical protein